MYKAIRKYGEEQFEIKLIKEVFNKNKAFQTERRQIILFNSKTPNGYNLTDGGEGAPGIKRSLEQFAVLKKLYSIPVVRGDGKRTTAGGYKWKLLNNDPIEKRIIEQNRRKLNQEKSLYKRRKIYCFTNGKEYVSLLEAGKELNIDFRIIFEIVNNIRKHYNGYKFKYIND